MPIDASIPFRATQGINTPFENLSGMLQIQQQQQQQEAHALALSKAKRAEQEQMAIQQIVTESGGDLSDETLKKIMTVAPTVGLKFKGDILDNRKKLGDATKAEMDAEAKQTEWGLSMLNAAKANPALYPQVRAAAISRGGDLADLLRQQPTFNPSVVDALLQSGLTAKEQIDMNQKTMDAMMKGDYRYLAGAINAVKDDPEELQELIGAATFMGAPKAMIDALMSNPAAMSQTESERQTDDDRGEHQAISREGQRITLRGQDMSAETARRGQDLLAATARAGQAITARGQDMTAASSAARTAAQKAGGAGGAKLSAGAIDKIAGADTALGSLDQIGRMFPAHEGTLGPLAGRFAQARQNLPGADEAYAEFASEVATLKNSVIKATTGAAMSEPEAKRIMSQIPDLTNQPEVFKARMKTTRRNLETLKRRTIELSGGGAAAGDEDDSGADGGGGGVDYKFNPRTGKLEKVGG